MLEGSFWDGLNIKHPSPNVACFASISGGRAPTSPLYGFIFDTTPEAFSSVVVQVHIKGGVRREFLSPSSQVSLVFPNE